VGGRPFGVCRNVRQGSRGGGGHLGSAVGRFSSEKRAKPATGPGFVSCQPTRRGEALKPVRACGGHVGCMACRVRAGTSRPTRAVSPDRGRSNPGGNLVDKPLPRSARRHLSDADIIRRCSGRARAAPPSACRVSDNGHAQLIFQRQSPCAALRTYAYQTPAFSRAEPLPLAPISPLRGRCHEVTEGQC